MSFADLLVAASLLAGSSLMLIASIGLVRFPEIYCRLHAVAKSFTLGIISLLFAATVFFHDPAIATKGLLVILFYFITSPTSTHLIARTALRLNIPAWIPSAHDAHERRRPRV